MSAVDAEGAEQPQPKRIKPSKALSPEAQLGAWTQCQFFMARKQRYCNVQRSPGSVFCGNHRPESEAAPRRVRKLSGSTGGSERIPCPADPSHTVYACDLATHLKICNATKDQARLEKEPYYQLNVNSGNNAVASETEQVDADLLLERLTSAYVIVCEDLVTEPVVSTNIEEIRAKCVGALGSLQTSFAQLRHVHQDAQLIGVMDAFGLLDGSDRVFVEMGAGKGKLGVCLHVSVGETEGTRVGEAEGARVVFVERAGQRRKADRADVSPRLSRIRMDLRHINLAKLPQLLQPPSAKAVIVAKHLCGAASDLAIRSALPPTVGLCIATCCHHACTWADYTGATWLLAQGFTAADFEVMKFWTGWAGLLVEGEEEHPGTPTTPNAHDTPMAPNAPRGVQRPALGNSHAALKHIGHMAKRVIDHGRLVHLRSLSFTATQMRYCCPSLSPECFALLARLPSDA